MGFFYCTVGKLSLLVGRDKKNDIVVEDEMFSRLHAIVECSKDPRTAYIKITGLNGLMVNGVMYSCGSRLVIGLSDIIEFGELTVIWLGKYIYVSGAKSAKAIESEYFVKNICKSNILKPTFVPAIRKINHIDLCPIEIEGPPPRRAPEKPSVMFAAGPALTMAIPIMLGMGRKLSIISSVAAAIWAAGNVINRQRKQKNEEKRRRNSYYAYINSCEENIRRRHEECVTGIRREFPPLDDYLAGGPNPFLIWNRDISLPDGFMIRVGIGNLASPLKINVPKDKFTQLDDSLKELPYKLQEKFLKLTDVPVCLDFNKVKVIGFLYDANHVANNKAIDKAMRVLSAILLEFMLLIKPDELSIISQISNEMLAKEMSWIELSPHFLLLDEEEPKAVRLLVTDDVALANSFVVNEGSLIILLKNQMIDFPAIVESVVSVKENFQGIINLHEPGQKKIVVNFDLIPKRQCEEYARLLASLWHKEEDDTTIPGFVSFETMFQDEFLFDDSDVNIIENYWERGNIRQSIAFPVGIGANGKTIYLDLHEKRHGPHGIAAGSTGSGKSELLTTIILSAAMLYPPDKLGFFLIDYKGGGMSNLFRNLPHLLGSISNLSPTESYRAMISIKSENTRRQQIFLDVGVNNINDYMKLYEEGRVSRPLPHVLIIIDEFAELKKEEPEYMAQLISVAAVGRSLGIHLILATQKPSGVVDDKIRSNSKFRICLRVEDKSDSQDMLHKGDAADIRECGRGYLQVGNDEIYDLFQGAYAMGKLTKKFERKEKLYDKNFNPLEIDWDNYRNDRNLSDRNLSDRNLNDRSRNNSCGIPDMENMGKDGFGENYREDERIEERHDGFVRVNEILTRSVDKNWQEYIVELICKAQINSDIKKPSPLWLPSLEEYIPLRIDLASQDNDNENQLTSVNIERNLSYHLGNKQVVCAIADDPYSQSYHPITYNPSDCNNVLVVGGPASGKSNMLSIFLLNLAGRRDEDVRRDAAVRKDETVRRDEDVRKDETASGDAAESKAEEHCSFYIVDGGGNTLEIFSQSNMCGGYILAEESNKVLMLLKFIGDIIRGRRRGNKKDNYYQEFKDRIMLVVDNFGECFRTISQEAEGLIGEILKYGKSVGVFTIISCLNIGQGELSFRLAGQMDKIYIFGFQDPFTSAGLLKIQARDIPKITLATGRGICLVGDRALEFQALINKDFEKISSVIELRNAHECYKSLVYPHIPDNRSFQNFITRSLIEFPVEIQKKKQSIPIGYDEQTGRIAMINLHEISCVIISGRPGSGKESFLHFISEVASAYNINCSTITSFESLVAFQHEATEDNSNGGFRICLIDNLEQIFSKIEENDTVLSLFDNSKRNKGMLIISLLGDKPSSEFRIGRLFERIMNKPYVVYFGGCLDEQRIFDFSYLPYSVQSKRKASGLATVMKYDNRSFYGDLLVPEMDDLELEDVGQ